MSKEHDAIIVGLGLNGSWAAKELTESGLNVLAIDQGYLLEKSYFKNLPIASDSPTMKDKFFSLKSKIFLNEKQHKNALLFRRWKKLWQKFYIDPFISKIENFEWYRSNAIGGRGHVWGRVSPRFTNRELEAKWLKKVDYKWPLKEEEINKIYKEIEKILILGGQKNNNGFNNSANYLRKRSLNIIEEEIKNKLVKHSYLNNFNVSPILEYEPGPFSPMLESAVKTKKLKIINNTIVKNLEFSKDNFVNGVKIINKKNFKEHTLNAKIIILAASPLQSVRILRNSISEFFPRGVGNSSNLLGKYIFDHVHCFRDIKFNFRKKNSIKYQNEIFNPFKPNTDSHGFFILPPKKKYVKKNLNGKFSIQGYISINQKKFHLDSFGEMFPRKENRIEFDFNNKNKFGLPKPVIYFKYNDNEKLMWNLQNEHINKLVNIFYKLPYVKKKSDFNKILTHKEKKPLAGSSSHEMGGARMGTTNKNSVVNKDGRLWDSPNVIICDASIFPSAGYQNITLTSMALAVKNSRNIIKIKKNGKLTII